MSEEFTKGDMVRLKSGGPKMMVTVRRQSYGESTGEFWCQWFDEKNRPQRAVFHPETLEKVESD